MNHSSPQFLLAVTAWTLMMSAMMLPGYMPWIRVHASIARRDKQNPILSTVLLIGGYLTAWVGYSILAASVQVGLHRYALLDNFMRLNGLAAGLLLMVVGIFQFTSLKTACLSKCRNPMSFMLAQSHDGKINSYSLGLKQGAFCVGCCWGLMVLGFVVGLANVWWMFALTILVTVEKLAPYGKQVGRVTGVTLVVWGAYLL